MNVVGISDIQRLVAQEVGKRRGIKVRVGRYTDKSDSLHIYGKDFHGTGGTKECLDRISRQNLNELTWTTDDLKEIFLESRHVLAAQLESEKRGAGKGVILPDIDAKTFPYPAEWDE